MQKLRKICFSKECFTADFLREKVCKYFVQNCRGVRSWWVLNNFLKAARYLGLVKCSEIFHFNWNFEHLIIFQHFDIPSIALKCWNFSEIWISKVTFSKQVSSSQYKVIWQQKNELTMEPFKKYVTCTMKSFNPIHFCHTFTVLLCHLPCATN